ncbi:hypothetical protein QQG55_56415 [Brugia pahangi]
MCIKQITNKVHLTLCSCSVGYGGEKCEILYFGKVFLHYRNVSMCCINVSINGSAICHCSMGYFGHNCEYTFDKNGGTCIDAFVLMGLAAKFVRKR